MAKSNYIVRGGGDFSNLYNEFNKAQKRMNSFKATMTKTMKGLGIALGGLAIGKVVKDSLNAASELEGAFVGLESILTGQGKSFNKAKTFIDDYIKDGLVPLGNAVTAYKNLAQRGYDDEQIQQVMSRLKDAAAFGRQSHLSLGEAVSTATEGLRNEVSTLVDNAGVTKNVAKMHLEYAKSIGKTTQQLTLQEKIQAEVNGIMEETKFQIGDAAKYADTYAGRLSALKKVLQDIKVNLGNAFMPIANVVLPLLNALASRLQYITAIFAAFTQALFGKATKAQVKQTQAQAGAVEDLGDATDEAGKKAKGALAGFDEINQLDRSSGGAAAGGAGAQVVDTTQTDDGTGGAMGELSTKAEEMANKIKTAFSNMKNTIAENKEIIISALTAIGAGFAAFEIITHWTAIVKGFTDAIALISGAVTGISTPILGITALIGLLVGNIIYLWQTNEDFRNSVIEVWNKIKSVVTTIASDMWAIVKGIWDKYGQTLLENLAGFMVSIQTLILTVWESFLKPVIMGALEMLSWLWTEHLSGLVQQIGEFVMKCVNGALEIWNKFISPIVNWMVKTFGPTVANVIKFAIDVFGSLLAGVIDIAKGLFKALGGVVDFIVGVFTGNWKKAWEGVKNIFKGIFDSLYGIVKVPLNLIIDAINTVIRGLNKINIKIPDWVPGFGGKSWGINISTIPKLARGGIIDSPTLAMVGERGPEAVVPLENTGFVDAIASAVGSAVLAAMNVTTDQSSGSSGDIVLNIDGRTFGRLVKPYIDQESKRIGADIRLNPI